MPQSALLTRFADERCRRKIMSGQMPDIYLENVGAKWNMTVAEALLGENMDREKLRYAFSQKFKTMEF